MICYAILLTTRKEMSKINRLYETIQKEKKISKVHLVMQSGISISYFEKLRPFLLEIYSHSIIYDKDDKLFIAIKNEPIIKK